MGAPASVKSSAMSRSRSQSGSAWLGSWAKRFSIIRSTSSSEVAVSFRMMLAWARKPSRSRCARTSSSKFFNFRYYRDRGHRTTQASKFDHCLDCPHLLPMMVYEYPCPLGTVSMRGSGLGWFEIPVGMPGNVGDSIADTREISSLNP